MKRKLKSPEDVRAELQLLKYLLDALNQIGELEGSLRHYKNHIDLDGYLAGKSEASELRFLRFEDNKDTLERLYEEVELELRGRLSDFVEARLGELAAQEKKWKKVRRTKKSG
ncbi:MAG: hypothetical protein HY394_01910 [Candidatus Diapherotrites archaeon]|nr:hypothetical protein [Candidatus Diapherotrites archaeon]